MRKKIELGYLKPFNYIVYAYNNDLKCEKLDDKSIKCKFLSYKKGNQYRLQDSAKQHILISAQVKQENDSSINRKDGSNDEAEANNKALWEFFTPNGRKFNIIVHLKAKASKDPSKHSENSPNKEANKEI